MAQTHAKWVCVFDWPFDGLTFEMDAIERQWIRTGYSSESISGSAQDSIWWVKMFFEMATDIVVVKEGWVGRLSSGNGRKKRQSSSTPRKTHLNSNCSGRMTKNVTFALHLLPSQPAGIHPQLPSPPPPPLPPAPLICFPSIWLAF